MHEKNAESDEKSVRMRLAKGVIADSTTPVNIGDTIRIRNESAINTAPKDGSGTGGGINGGDGYLSRPSMVRVSSMVRR